jgi:hypothetical protein
MLSPVLTPTVSPALTPVAELKIQAKKLLKNDSSNPELLKLAKGEPPKLKHCQLFIARKYGFANWDHVRQVLEGNACEDYGSFWYKSQCGTLLNHWCTSHEEAKQVQQENGGTILPYKRQFMVVDKPFLSIVGAEYDDPAWIALNHDWCSGAVEARLALALKRIQR